MRIVDDGSPAPAFWSYVLGHDNLSPVEHENLYFFEIYSSIVTQS